MNLFRGEQDPRLELGFLLPWPSLTLGPDWFCPDRGRFFHECLARAERRVGETMAAQSGIGATWGQARQAPATPPI